MSDKAVLVCDNPKPHAPHYACAGRLEPPPAGVVDITVQLDALCALAHVSFYARVNHGTKCRDYGEVVNPVLKAAGLPTGVLLTPTDVIRQTGRKS